MSKKATYRQCKMQKKTATGYMEQTSYIPEPYCKVGKIVKLRGSDGVWDDGWEVVFASQKSYTEEQTNMQSHQYTKHRQATDI